MNELDRLCERCGRPFSAANAADTNRVCADCEPKPIHHGMKLVNPEASRQSGEGHSVSDLHGGPILPKAHNGEEAPMTYRGPQRAIKKSSPWWGAVGFLLTAGILIGLLYGFKVQKDQFPLDYYLWTRIGAWALFLVALLIQAFRDSPTTGWLTLALPPYTAYFALERVNLFWLRGMFIALCLTLVAELYWARYHSILLDAQRRVNTLIQGGHDALRDAGESSPLRR